MPFKKKEIIPESAPAAAEAPEPESIKETSVPETISPVLITPAAPAPKGPAYFTVTVDGLVFTPSSKQRGVSGQQYIKGQFYPTSPFLRHIYAKKDGAVVPYEGDPEVRKENIYATPHAPYQWTEPEFEEVPDLFTGEDMT